MHTLRIRRSLQHVAATSSALGKLEPRVGTSWTWASLGPASVRASETSTLPSWDPLTARQLADTPAADCHLARLSEPLTAVVATVLPAPRSPSPSGDLCYDARQLAGASARRHLAPPAAATWRHQAPLTPVVARPPPHGAGQRAGAVPGAVSCQVACQVLGSGIASARHLAPPQLGGGPTGSGPAGPVPTRQLAGGAGGRAASTSAAARGGAAQAPCWSCGAERVAEDHFFCRRCGAVLPVDHGANYFAIFGLSPRFPIDTEALEAKYKALQKRLHPDMHSRKAEEERAYSASQSAEVIKGYYTLLRPLSRAKYLLRLLGRVVASEADGIGATAEDQELLMEVMETREQILEAKDDGELRALQALNKEKMAQCVAELSDAFDRKELDKAHTLTQRLIYLTRIDDEILRHL